MTDTPHADRGSIITYLDDTDPCNGEFRRAVVTGAGVVDPETDVVWVSVVRPDCELTLIDPAMIMAEVDERAPVALRDSQNLLNRFTEAIAPIEYSLCVLVEADPKGALATVLNWISSAAEFERGDVAVGRCGIMMANSAMAELVPPADEP